MPDLIVTCPNGKVLQFKDDTYDRVRFGRDAGWANVVLDESLAEQGVGREHCELVASAGGFSLEMNPQNRVWIDGKDGFDGTVLPRQCTLAFTPNSPLTAYCLQTSMTGGAETKYVHGLARVKGRRLSRVMLSGILLCVVAIATLAINSFDKAFSEASIQLAESATFSVQTSLNGRVSHAGTAWLAAPNMVVTNRHVAQLVKASIDQANRGMNSAAFIRLTSVNNEEGATRPISAVIYHPAEALFRQYQVQHMAPFKSEFSLDLDVYDIAILQLDGPELPMRPIPLADNGQVSAMKTGEPLMIVGYPLNKAGNAWDLLRPVPERKLGVFDKTRNVFSSEGDTTVNPLLSYDVDTRGGNSGSPVLNQKGEVVAIHFAGDKLLLEGATINGQQTTTLIDGWKSYGQHIRLVKQMVDGSIFQPGALEEEQKIWARWLATVPSVKDAAIAKIEQQLTASLYRCEAVQQGSWHEQPEVSARKRRFTQMTPLPAYQHFYAYVQSLSGGAERIDVSAHFGEQASYSYNGTRHYAEFADPDPSSGSQLTLTLGGPNTPGNYIIFLVVWSETDCSDNNFVLQKAG